MVALSLTCLVDSISDNLLLCTTDSNTDSPTSMPPWRVSNRKH